MDGVRSHISTWLAAIAARIPWHPSSWGRALPPIESPPHATQSPTLVSPSPGARILDSWRYALSPRSAFTPSISESPSPLPSPIPSSPPPSQPLDSTNSPPPDSALFNHRLPNVVDNQQSQGIHFDETPLVSEYGRPLPEPPSTLSIEIDESTVSFDAKVERFIKCNAQRTDNSLSFSWGADRHGLLGRVALVALFDRLNGTEDDVYCAIKCFRRMAFTAPSEAYKGPFHLLGNHPSHHDCIDFANASALCDFSWQGDIYLLTGKCLNVPFANLLTLSVASTAIYVYDAVVLLHSCPKLASCSVGTLDNVLGKQRPCGNLKASDTSVMYFPNLEVLKITSNEPLRPIFERIRWSGQLSLTLAVAERGVLDLENCIRELGASVQLALKVPTHIGGRDRDKLHAFVPNLCID